jgi:hypothetical protein
MQAALFIASIALLVFSCDGGESANSAYTFLTVYDSNNYDTHNYRLILQIGSATLPYQDPTNSQIIYLR